MTPMLWSGSAGDDGWRVIERRAGTRHDLHADLALLLSTSGSTGSPKLVRLSYENLDSNAESIAEYLDIDSADRAMTSLPLSYCYGLSVLHSHLTRGAAVIVTGLSVVDPGFWDLARTAQATAFAGVPYTFELLDRVGFADLDLPSLRYVTQAGGKLGADQVRKFAELGRRRGWDLVVMYGQTEATARMAYLPVDRVLDAPEAIGVPIPGGRFTIDDDGELIYHGPNVMLGYAESAEDFALGPHRSIALRTGDLARLRRMMALRDRRAAQSVSEALRPPRRPGPARDELRADDIHGTVHRRRHRVGGRRHERHARRRRGHLREGGPARHRGAHLRPRRSAANRQRQARLRRCAAECRSAASTGGLRSRRPADGVRAIYREILNVDYVGDTDTFVGLGGESLSFVETITTTRTPTRHASGGMAPAERRRTRGRCGGQAAAGSFRWMETSVVLRAVAIVMVCANHVGLGHVLGRSAHPARRRRLQLRPIPTQRRRFERARPSAVPIDRTHRGALGGRDRHRLRGDPRLRRVEHAACREPVRARGWALGPDGWDPAWNYWFIEVLVVTSRCCARLCCRSPLCVASNARIRSDSPLPFLGSAWCCGSSFSSATSRWRRIDRKRRCGCSQSGGQRCVRRGSSHRLLLTVAAVCGSLLPGFFDDQHGRKLVILAGLLLLIWVTRIPVLGRHCGDSLPSWPALPSGSI